MVIFNVIKRIYLNVRLISVCVYVCVCVCVRVRVILNRSEHSHLHRINNYTLHSPQLFPLLLPLILIMVLIASVLLHAHRERKVYVAPLPAMSLIRQLP